MSVPDAWMVGAHDESGDAVGFWQTYDRSGALVSEEKYLDGEEISSLCFRSPEHGVATLAAREGRAGQALEAARQWWARLSSGAASASGEDRISAGELLSRCLGDDAEHRHERREVSLTVAALPVSQSLLADERAQIADARAAVLAWLAADALASGDVDAALTFADESIEAGRRSGGLAAKVTKVAALRHRGRADEAYALTQEVFITDPDAAGLAEFRADPQFAAWIDTLRVEHMTVDGAWAIMGKGGARLHAIADLLGYDPGDTYRSWPGLDIVWPIQEVLGERISPELSRWIDVMADRPSANRRRLHPAVSSTVSAAVSWNDDAWVARLQSLFLPMSTVSVNFESSYHAAWLPDVFGNSATYYSYQDQDGFVRFKSLSLMLATVLLREAEDDDVVAQQMWTSRLNHARSLINKAAVASQLTGEPLPPHLSVTALYPRTGWIVSHLLPQRQIAFEVEHDLTDAPRDGCVAQRT